MNLNHQKQIQMKIKRALLVFSLAFFMMMLVLSLSGFGLFGDKTMLINDMDIQYIEYMKGFKNFLFDFVFYNFYSGVGTNMLPMYTYYLSSPFQWLLLLFENEMLYVMIPFVYAIKIALCAATMDLFLQYRYGYNNKHIMFALCYGFSAMGVVYSQSLMWIDGLYMLPLLILGVEKSIQTQKFGFLGLMVALSYLFNFYTAVMSMLLCGVVFLVRLFQLNIKKPLIIITKTSLSVLLGIGVNMVLLLPSFLSIMSNRGSSVDVLTTSTTIDRFLGLNSLFMLEEAKTLGIEKSFIYCGLICVLLVIASFFSKKLSNREKWGHAILLGVLILSVVNEFLYSGWHLFSMPYGFPTRFAYCISFVMILIASSTSEEENKKGMTIAFCITLVLLMGRMSMEFEVSMLLTNLFFLVCVFLFWILKRKFVLGIVIIELVISSVYIFDSLNKDNQYEGYRDLVDVLQYDAEMQAVLDEIDLKDNERMESTFKNNLNESYALGYSSISHYSSTYNKKIHDFLEHTGATSHLFGSQYEGTTLFLDSLLGVKYVLHNESDYVNGTFLENYNQILEIDGIGVYENPYALDIAFVSDPVEEAKLSEYRSTLYQNDIANRLGASDKLINEITFDKIYVWDSLMISEDPYVYQNEFKEDTDSRIGIYPNIDEVKEGTPMYMQLRYVDNESWYMLVSGFQNRGHHYTGYDSGSRYLGLAYPNEEFLVECILTGEYLRFTDAYFYSLDLDVLKDLSTQLHNEPEVEFSRHLDTITMNVELNEVKDLIVTYPYDEGWTCTVNGVPTKIEQYESTFLKIALNPGENEIVLSYVPTGLKLGLVLSVFSVLCSVCWVFITKKKQSN